jgi:nucleoside-diphosphate-sugar epimerase
MMVKKKKILVTGSSGFIGSNLVSKLHDEGHYVIGIDIENPKYSTPDKFFNYDLRYNVERWREFNDIKIDEVYCLACLMGGMGYIGDEEKYGCDISVGSTQIIINIIEWCKQNHPESKVFFSSSACVYNQDLQKESKIVALKESDAIPANPDLLYGWQKLYAEKMFMASGLDVRIARFHNVFGRWGTYDGGKEKAPAAMSRKVAMAKDGDEIEVWGTGNQTRSFLHIDEALTGVEKLMSSDYKNPLNIGSDELVTINQLAEMAIEISGKKLTIKNIPGNVGVQGRNSDNTLCQQVLSWRPTEQLYWGMEKLYSWVNEQVNGRL